MLFSEVQKKIFELVNNGGSVASHLECHALLRQKNFSAPEYFRKINVAFLSNFNLRGFPEVFETRAIFHNLQVNAFLGPYNQYAQEILNPNSGLYGSSPALIYLAIDKIDSDLGQLRDLVKNLLVKSQARIVVFNTALKDELKNETRALLFDFDSFLLRIGKEKYWYTKYKELGDLRLAPEGFPVLADALLAFSIGVSGATKKCLVLDFDNTLWKGIVGEDGYENIVPVENLQKHILGLYEKGTILAINSRNNPEDALAVLDNHPKMILRRNHFAAWRINWQDKSLNIKELAEELNLGSDSFVFLDDEDFQRHAVQNASPEVAVLHPNQLENYPGFYSLTLTEEDMRRGQMYAEERNRKELQSSLRRVEDFLRQLNLEVAIRSAENSAIVRVSQLTQKTNQFNLTTKRYSEEQIKKFLSDGGKIWTIQAKDRFGDYGIIGLAMLKLGQKAWQIDNFLMSCRVLGRDLENAFLTFVLEQAKNHGVTEVVGEFIPTAKNKPCEPFYKKCDFEFVENKDNRYVYKYNLERGQLAYPKFIKLV